MRLSNPFFLVPSEVSCHVIVLGRANFLAGLRAQPPPPQQTHSNRKEGSTPQPAHIFTRRTAHDTPFSLSPHTRAPSIVTPEHAHTTQQSTPPQPSLPPSPPSNTLASSHLSSSRPGDKTRKTWCPFWSTDQDKPLLDNGFPPAFRRRLASRPGLYPILHALL